MVKMARSLDVPPEAESVLTIPKGFMFMDASSVGSNLFVRPCYVQINRQIFDDYQVHPAGKWIQENKP